MCMAAGNTRNCVCAGLKVTVGYRYKIDHFRTLMKVVGPFQATNFTRCAKRLHNFVNGQTLANPFVHTLLVPYFLCMYVCEGACIVCLPACVCTCVCISFFMFTCVC